MAIIHRQILQFKKKRKKLKQFYENEPNCSFFRIHKSKKNNQITFRPKISSYMM